MMKATRWIVCAAVLLPACGGAPPPPPAGSDPPAAHHSQAAEPPAFVPDRVGEWMRDGDVQRYGPGNLWEYINGGAEQYLAYGFEDVAAARYRDASGAVATLDVYRMSDSVGAFGIFMEERSPRAAALALGVDAYAGSDSLRFWTGSYYVKLSVTPASDATPEALQRLGHAIAARLGGGGAPPREIGYLPTDGLVAGSLKYIPADALGQRFLSKAFQGVYATGATETTLLLLPCSSASAARDAMTQYGAFLAESGAPPAPLAGLGDDAWSAQDGFYGRIVASRSGPFVLITLGAPDLGAARALMTATLARLPGPAAPSGKAGRP